MRYFLLILALTVVTIMGVAGKRGSLSRQPPIEIFPDMDRQPKLRPQEPNAFFADGKSSREHPAGTVAHAAPLMVNGQAVYPHEDAPVNTGKITGTTNFVETNPFPVTDTLMARGQQRYQINCLPCHGPQADGNGITKKLGMGVVANLQEKRFVTMTDGEVFHTISNGKNLMGSYAANVTVPDRWAIVAYLRALQLSKLATLNDVPAEMQSKLKK